MCQSGGYSPPRFITRLRRVRLPPHTHTHTHTHTQTCTHSSLCAIKILFCCSRNSGLFLWDLMQSCCSCHTFISLRLSCFPTPFLSLSLSLFSPVTSLFLQLC